MLLKVIAVEKLLQMPGAYARNFAKPSDTSKIKSLLCSRRICLTLENGHFSVLSVLSSVQGSTWTSAAFGGELGCLVDDIWVSSFFSHFHGKFI